MNIMLYVVFSYEDFWIAYNFLSATLAGWIIMTIQSQNVKISIDYLGDEQVNQVTIEWKGSNPAIVFNKGTYHKARNFFLGGKLVVSLNITLHQVTKVFL